MAKILWVEDEANKIGGLIRPLIKNGHVVDIAQDKSEAISMLKGTAYDLVILDIIIPDGQNDTIEEIYPYEGLNVIIHIHDNYKSIPVIILSVVNDSNVLRKIRNLGYNTILSKGMLLPSQLLEYVAESLGLNDD
ncbi:MAG: response regulator [Desulfocapsaceae bacterium]|nr:response regulator [Desulfocapsaceae bacterium]